MIKKIIITALLFSLIFSAFTLTAPVETNTLGTGLIICEPLCPKNSITTIQDINLSSEPQLDLSQTPYFPRVRSQEYQSSCTSFALTYYAYGFMQSHFFNYTDSYSNPSHQASPSFTYNMACGGYDSGSSFSMTGLILRDWGASSYSSFPFDPDDCTTWGNEYAFKSASSNIPVEGFLMAYNEQTTLDDLKYLLNDYRPVCFAIDTQNYAGLQGDNLLTPEEIQFFSFNHANTIIGYDDSTQSFKIVNSWGTSFADQGFYRMTYDAMNISSTYFYYLSFAEEEEYRLEWRFMNPPSRDARFQINGVTLYHATDSFSFPNFLCATVNTDNIILSLGETEEVGAFTSVRMYHLALGSNTAVGLPLQNPCDILISFVFCNILNQECEVLA